MSKKREQRPGFGRILDEWSPPQEAGAPIGCLASTFTLETAFFEEDCLGRFLQLETNAEDHGAAFLIEREEKLAAVKCAVIVDARNAQGRRSPRWDMLLSRVPAACQHAKVSLLQWEHHVRIIVTSANSTEAGHCENLEVFGVLNYFDGSPYTRRLGREVMAFMRELLGSVTSAQEATTRARLFLDGVEMALSKWSLPDDFSTRDAVQIRFIASQPGGETVLDQLKELWPSGTAPHTAIVTSPYFDEEASKNLPADALWALMRTRGDTSVCYQAPSDSAEGDRHIVNAPASILLQKPGRRSAKVAIAGIPQISSDEKGNSVLRALHAKVIHLRDDRWSLAMLGSSNFTSKGLGLVPHCNIEANLVYRIDESSDRNLVKNFEQSLPLGNELDAEKVIWTPSKDECESDSDSVPILPPGFESATLLMLPDKGRIVRLTFSDTLPATWTVSPDGILETLIDVTEWKRQGSPKSVEIPWTKLAAPSGLEVHLPDERLAAWWAVNIADPSALPPPEELCDLPLELLLEILTSAAPLYRVVMRWRDRQQVLQKNKFESTQDLDALSRVNVSSFILQRTRRVSKALMALRRSLERPIASKESLVWRISGPVGVEAVIKAIESEARSPEETAFLLTELSLELRRVRPSESPFGPTPEEVQAAIDEVCIRIATKIDAINLDESSRIFVYARTVLRRA
jgi:hypothetical protein